jgi:acyl-CoA thioesterase I
VNASVSGDTTRAGLARLPRALDRHRPAIVVIELGGNDGLRGLPLSEVRTNLTNAITLAQKHQAKVLLVGMRLPTNYGTSHTQAFHTLYAELGRKHQVPVVPFLLEGVATDPVLMQPDGVHPTAAAQPKLLATVWPFLAPLLKSEGSAR